MKMNAMLRYYGGKAALAPAIHAELGLHASYWEPCVGGFGAFMTKPRASSHETVNDLHGDATNLARVIADDDLGPRLFERGMRTLLCEDLLAQFDAEVRDGDYEGPQPNLDRAYAFFVASWMGRGGEVGIRKSERGRKIAVRWTHNGGSPAVRFKSAVDSIPYWHRRLRNVTILRRNMFEVLAEIRDATKTVIYVDPPYIKKSDEYVYDFVDAPPVRSLFAKDVGDYMTHERLAESLNRFENARVVVSYYEHPRLAKLYPEGKWTRVRPKITKNSRQASGKDRADAPEVLLINGPSLTGATQCPSEEKTNSRTTTPDCRTAMTESTKEITTPSPTPAMTN